MGSEMCIRDRFYYLVPANVKGRRPLFIASLGHDLLGLHSYSGSYKNGKHREEILAREGNIAEQAARR